MPGYTDTYMLWQEGMNLFMETEKVCFSFGAVLQYAIVVLRFCGSPTLRLRTIGGIAYAKASDDRGIAYAKASDDRGGVKAWYVIC